MSTFFSYLLLTAYCLLGLSGKSITQETVIGFLAAIIIVSLSLSLQSSKSISFLFYLYAGTAMLCPSLYFFVPISLLEIGRRRAYSCMALLILGFLGRYRFANIPLLLFLLLGCGFAFLLQHLQQRYEILYAKHRKMRDDSTERNLLLKQRNRSLLEKQDYEIHNATLQERNRIAREIHDNVGHLLSRCILLNGALQTMNRDESCNESLLLLQDTLSQAMDNIRSSVHNLHDDSINLQEALRSLVRDFTFCPAHIEYDITAKPPSTIRYAFLAITKEALTNVSRHSNATHVSITVREHPAMYQLIIHDNGKTCKDKIFSFHDRQSIYGIGLVNIHDRVKSLHGIFQINTEQGFQIFISIPKKVTEWQ